MVRPRLTPPLRTLAALALLGAGGCDDRTVGAESVADAATGDGGARPGAPLVIARRGATPANGAAHWLARLETSGQIVAEAPLGACSEAEREAAGAADPDACATLPDVPPGAYTVTVFDDRDANGALDGCPFPPQVDDAAHADDFENLVGHTEVNLLGDAPVVALVDVDRRTCGPGAADTGLTGRVTLPADLEGPLFARLTASTACPTATAEVRAPLVVALGAPASAGELTFSLGELLPGCFAIDFFADADGDRLPTACDGTPPGGDWALARVDAVEIVGGQRRPLAEPVALAPAACPDLATGVRGTVGLGAGLAEAVSAGALPPETLDAAPRLVLTALADGQTFDWPLAFDEMPGEGARPFTFTGVPPGRYDAALYLDADADGRFTPCGGLTGGVDGVFELRMGVEVEAGALAELGEVRLQRSPACADAGAEIAIRPEIDLESGPVGSGRPVRLELAPLDADGEPRSVLLFENHRDLDARPAGADGAWHLGVQVRKGRYRARVFVDTDRNGVYGPCADDPFQDRQAAEPQEVVFGDGPVVDLGHVHVLAQGCVVPDAAVGPSFELPPGVSAPADHFIRFEIAESGGWTEAYPRRDPVESEALPYVPPPVKLAPGVYTLRVWLDAEASGLLDGCEAATPDAWVGATSFTLDSATPAARPHVTLEPACPL